MTLLFFKQAKLFLDRSGGVSAQVAAFEGEVGVLAAAEGAGEVEAAGDVLDAGVLGKAQGLGQELRSIGGHHALIGLAGVVAQEVAGQGNGQFLKELAGDARPHDERAYREGGCAGRGGRLDQMVQRFGGVGKPRQDGVYSDGHLHSRLDQVSYVHDARGGRGGEGFEQSGAVLLEGDEADAGGDEMRGFFEQSNALRRDGTFREERNADAAMEEAFHQRTGGLEYFVKVLEWVAGGAEVDAGRGFPLSAEFPFEQVGEVFVEMGLALGRGVLEAPGVAVNAGMEAAAGGVDGQDVLETAQRKGLEERGAARLLDESDWRHWRRPIPGIRCCAMG